MKIVIITAFGVGGATVIGGLLGFLFKRLSHNSSDVVLSFSAGVMLAASVLGLILPAMELTGPFGCLVPVCGIFAGAFCLALMDRLVPHIRRLAGIDRQDRRSHKVLLLVTAIALHNFPEGVAAGVGFGSSSISDALLIAGGIAMQNIPEGMVIIGPMLSVGISKRKTLLCALATGATEVIGTLLGYWAVSIAAPLLPFILAFAGGTMLYVISAEMIPETHADGAERGATYSLLAGFCAMLVLDQWIG